MNWTSEHQQRFTELRLRELDGLLSKAEQKELLQLRSAVGAIEDATITPVLAKLEQENIDLQTMLTSLKRDNEDLLALSQRQTRLITDTKQWISEFEQRYSGLQNDFVRLTQSM